MTEGATAESESRIAAIAARLSAAHPGAPFAFLDAGEAVYWSSFQPAPHAPFSPVTRLIQGVYERHPASARSLLRHRIYTNAPLTPMCHGMIKVAAKRSAVVSSALSLPTSEIPAARELLELSAHLTSHGALPVSELARLAGLSAGPPRGHQELMDLAFRLCAPEIRSVFGHERGRPIAALLVSAEGQLLEAALNTDYGNRTLHAEVNLLQTYFLRTGLPLPLGARLYTTLKPCRMCAGMIWHCAEDIQSLKVFFGEDDPGPHGRNTALTVGTAARATAAHGDAEFRAPVEFLLPPSSSRLY
ncbi:MAG: Bd3614 family nucleic acid deaminase [Oligoflexia bacterium]|nr:Bd3614 family nucleic acid deaminase [Oligoflexia bacterium]